MKKKELKNLAKKLAEAELILQVSNNEEQIKKAKETIYRVGYQLSSYDDMCYVDELVQDILKNIEKNLDK